MSEELLNIAKELSEKPTTELALQFMELTADNIIKGKENNSLWKQKLEYIDRISRAIEYINHYETIRGYYEYEEDGYDEYNYEDDLKQELLEILGGKE